MVTLPLPASEEGNSTLAWSSPAKPPCEPANVTGTLVPPMYTFTPAVPAASKPVPKRNRYGVSVDDPRLTGVATTAPPVTETRCIVAPADWNPPVERQPFARSPPAMGLGAPFALALAPIRAAESAHGITSSGDSWYF
jgi:hypothetical protein